MKNYIQKSFSFDTLAPKNVFSGTPFALGGFVCVPVCDALQGQFVTVYTEGIFTFDVTGKVNTGDTLYLHADGTINISSQSAIPCGFALESSMGGVVKVMLAKSINTSAKGAQ